MRYVSNYDRYDKVLMVDGDLESVLEVQRPDGLDDKAMSRGFYVSLDGRIVCVVASTDGPVLYVDGRKYSLASAKIQLRLDDVGEFRVFRVFADGCHELESLKMRKVVQANFDVWSDEESVDFFLWLSRNYTSESFRKYYAV